MGMGYQGFVRFYNTGAATPSNPSILLATGASVNLILEPIFSNAIWGAGWYNAATSAHYADAAIRYEGSVDIELQLGANGVIWDFLQDWISQNRAYPKSLDISPDGARVYRYWTSGAYHANYDLYGAWNMSAGFTTSSPNFVTSSLGTVALYRAEADPVGAHNYTSYSYIMQKTGVVAGNCNDLLTTNPLNPGGTNVNPIPFWQTNAKLLRIPDGDSYVGPFQDGTAIAPQTGLETVDWSVDVSQSHVLLYTCNGTRLPTALLMGASEVTGKCTLYNASGVFDPILGPNGTEGSLTDPYMYAANTIFRVAISNGAGGSVYLEIPAPVIAADDYGLKGQSDVTNRTFDLKGLGGRCYNTITLPPFCMSDSNGAFLEPAAY